MEKEAEGLSVTIEDVGPCKKRLEIEVPREKVEDEFERLFQEARSAASVPGFRKGKVPRSVIERQFGRQIEEEVKGTLVRDTYREVVSQHRLEPIGSPEIGNIDFGLKKGLKFDVTLEVKPTFEARDYKGLKLKRRSAVLAPEEVDAALKNVSLSRMQLVTEENGDVQGGDQVICDYRVLVDGREVHRDEEVALWVSGGMLADIPVPELFVALKGARVGDKREAETTLDGRFRLPEFRNKKATVEITVREIKRPRTPEIDDELARQFGASSLEELRESVRKRLEVDKRRWVEEDLQAQIYQKLVDMADFDLPEDLVAAHADDRLYRYKIDLLQRGKPMEEVERESEKLKGASREAAVRDLKLSLVMENIADKERLYVTEQEIEKRIQEMASVYQTTPAKMRKEIEKEGSLSALRHQMRESKVLSLILKNAVVEEEKEAETPAVPEREGVKEGIKGVEGKQDTEKKAE